MFFHLLHLYDMASTGLPYKDHPLYKLRLWTILAGGAGLILNGFAVGTALDGSRDDDAVGPIFISQVVLLFSFLFTIHDVVTYASKRFAHVFEQVRRAEDAQASGERNISAEQPLRITLPSPQDTNEDWPSKRLVITDFILAVVLQLLFWATLGAIIGGYHYVYRHELEVLEAYGDLASLATSILHAVAFWKELMARKHASWRRSLESEPCVRCGHVNVPELVDNRGPAQSFFRLFNGGKVALPRWARGPNARAYKEDEERNVENQGRAENVEEPLLATPDESTTELGGPSAPGGYGTLDQSVESIPETIVKKKDKGKKRLVEVD